MVINVEGLCQAGEIGSQRMHKGGLWTLDQQAKIGGTWLVVLTSHEPVGGISKNQIMHWADKHNRRRIVSNYQRQSNYAKKKKKHLVVLLCLVSSACKLG